MQIYHPPSSEACWEPEARHYLYLLHFPREPLGFKIGLTDFLRMRMVQLASAYGPCDLSRCVVLATRSRREAELLERFLKVLYEDHRYELTGVLAGRVGHTEWLRAGIRGPLMESILDWSRKRPGRSRMVPIEEVVREEKTREEAFREDVWNLTREERQEQRRQREETKEAARRQRNLARYQVCRQAIEEHLPHLRRVTFSSRPSERVWVCVRLLFMVRGPHGGDPRFDAATLGRRLLMHSKLELWPAEKRWSSVSLVSKHHVVAPRSEQRPARGFMVECDLPVGRFDADLVRHAPEALGWVNWLKELRLRVTEARRQRRCDGMNGQLPLF